MFIFGIGHISAVNLKFIMLIINEIEEILGNSYNIQKTHEYQ